MEGWRVAFQDEFIDDSQSWQFITNYKPSATIEDGLLTISCASGCDFPSGLPFLALSEKVLSAQDDFYIETSGLSDLSKSSDVGLVFFADPESKSKFPKLFAFQEISNSLFRLAEFEWPYSANVTTDSLRWVGQPIDKLAVLKTGDTIYMFANDQLVYQYEDVRARQGFVGLIRTSPRSSGIQFDNFTLRIAP